MTMDKNEMLVYMAKLDWLKKHLEALANFFFNLEEHSLCCQPHGDNILIVRGLPLRFRILDDFRTFHRFRHPLIFWKLLLQSS